MCIRDSNDANWQAHYLTTAEEIWTQTNGNITHFVAGLGTTCLLYTSDAADERSSVDLGGRRIIKKKT